MRLGIYFQGNKKTSRAGRDWWKMKKNRFTHEFSGGQRQMYVQFENWLKINHMEIWVTPWLAMSL